jgi:hypothetical protein
MRAFIKLYILITILIGCSNPSGEQSSIDTNSSLNTSLDSVPNNTLKESTTVAPNTQADSVILENNTHFDTLPDYNSFEDFLSNFEEGNFPLNIDPRDITGVNLKRLRFSKFYFLPDLKDPQGLNAFYGFKKYDIGNGKIAVLILTNIAPEFVGPDGELKTANIIVYNNNGKILNEQQLFKFYSVFGLMEHSWGEIKNDLSVKLLFSNSEDDLDTGEEKIEKGEKIIKINVP